MASAGKIYLIVYNVVQLFCWATGFTELVRCLLTKEDLWTVVGPGLKIYQTLAILEIVHTVVGLVKSSPAITSFQVFSRLMVLWGALAYSESARQSVGFPMLFGAWTLAEMIRYSFYLAALFKKQPYPLVWLRYSMFIILYPLGVAGELLVMYNTLPKVAAEQPFASLAPGDLNWAYYAYVAIMVLYIPVFPVLYGHMLSQRKKALGPAVQPRKRRD
ncbi:putative Very-long-chain (3R)-3-hydroxyacyl-CoA dehydratase 2 [Hypsibius exemplaris]|uniref:Very-long-chain (3R)-3-hydroxyacyl-CoA dehydratase n=1 Tax=Hypsibius exemplaris TaxID=2072580 RepID=A0A1W0WJM6_HYPEX|nr:putative Very-long-chain (3R)-3-hydroxyacyl-CoA dehydratase 2 [Hypsibius exemplaris]